MKPIPKELQAYFPKAADPARPWWSVAPFPNGVSFCPEWRRGEALPRPLLEAGRVDIDKADPMPPPPILVGQVWAYTLPARPDTTVVVQLLRIVLHTDRRDAVFGTDDFFATAPDLLAHGFLISCPYGYAPWSGVEAP